MIVNDLDLGGRPAILHPRAGQAIGSIRIIGSRTVPWPEAAETEGFDVSFWIEAWQAQGGAAANTLAANRFLRTKLKELAVNTDLQPVYIQWAQTAQTNPTYTARADADDGWFIISNVDWSMESNNQAGAIEASMTVTKVAPSAPSSLAIRWDGAPLVTPFVAVPYPLVGLPVGSGFAGSSPVRPGAEGSIPITLPSGGASGLSNVNPVPFQRSSTTANLFLGGCRVYDMISGSNAVPTTGAAVNANWVEVKGTSHDFQGDCILTNGLILLQFTLGVGGPLPYFWNTSLGTPAWQAWGTGPRHVDTAFNGSAVREVNLEKVGLQEVRVRTVQQTPTAGANRFARVTYRLVAGSYGGYMDWQPITHNESSYLYWSAPSTPKLKIVFNEQAVADVVLANSSLAASSNYGMAGGFGQGANDPLWGYLYKDQPTSQPRAGDGGINMIIDNNPAFGSSKTFGFFVIPVPGLSTANSEAEGGTLGTGWSSVADGLASGGNAAKCVSGTLSGNADLFGNVTSLLLPSGVNSAWIIDVYFRWRVASQASAVQQMQLGLWDATASAFVASTTYAPNGSSSSYQWIRVATGLGPSWTVGHTYNFRAVTTATTDTDWFIDEAAIVLRTGGPIGWGGPLEVWLQWAFDRTTRWVVG